MIEPSTFEATLTDSDFRIIRDLLVHRVGITLSDEKQYFVVNRLMPVMRANKIESLHKLVERLQSESDSILWDEAVDVLAVHETSFFRDEAPFCQMAREIIPQLSRMADLSGEQVNIWSAGCSTGQEAYSLAMLILEQAPHLRKRVRIVGSDISGMVLESAAQGHFRKFDVARGLSEQRLANFFCPTPNGWQAIDAMREMMDWKKFSLAGTWPVLPRFDLVLLRNVMVYFDVEVRDALIQRVHRQMNPGGRLLVGSAESLMALHHSFRPVTSHGATHYVSE